jgi:RNA-directed DNA polymerase
LRRIDFHLRKWARRKYKRFRQKPKGAREWFARIIRTNPALFAHWQLLHATRLDAGSRMS